MDEVTLRVSDIVCGYCVTVIERAVTRLAGVKSCEADKASKAVKVTFDPALVSLSGIEAAMEAHGYLPDASNDI